MVKQEILSISFIHPSPIQASFHFLVGLSDGKTVYPSVYEFVCPMVLSVI